MIEIKIIWTVVVSHDYFEFPRTDWGDLQPSQSTELLLRRRRMFFRKIKQNEWSLMQLEDNSLHEDDVLEFNFVCNKQNMLYTTDWEWNTDNMCRQIEVNAKSNHCIDMNTKPGHSVEERNRNIVFKLKVPPGGINQYAPVVTELHFTTKSYYWEYWLSPRNGDTSRDLLLEVEGANAEFKRIEDNINPWNLPFVKFRSTIPLKVVERGRERISLYERVSNDMKRLILRTLPLPELGRFPIDKADTVVTILYI